MEVIEGKITGIDLEDEYIVIGQEEYKLAEDVEIRLNNEAAVLEDLEVEMEVTAIELNGEVIEINALKKEVLEAQGKISAINLDEGYVVIGGVDYKLATEVIVTINEKAATVKELIVGMTVEAELSNGEIVKVYAEIIESSKVEGYISGLDLIGIYHLSVDNQKYHLLREAIVTVNDEEADLTDLLHGMQATIYLVGNDIIKVEATTVNRAREYGEIKDIDLIGIYHITVGSNEYALSQEAIVTIDGKEATLQELEIGMKANVLIEDETITEIDATTIL